MSKDLDNVCTLLANGAKLYARKDVAGMLNNVMRQRKINRTCETARWCSKGRVHAVEADIATASVKATEIVRLLKTM